MSPDRLSPAQRSALMSRIKSKWTKPEQAFLFHHVGAQRGEWLPHRPDFTWAGWPVYVESGFWHGDMKLSRYENMAVAWRDHLFRNVVRDRARDGFWLAVSGATLDLHPIGRGALYWEPGEGWLT